MTKLYTRSTSVVEERQCTELARVDTWWSKKLMWSFSFLVVFPNSFMFSSPTTPNYPNTVVTVLLLTDRSDLLWFLCLILTRKYPVWYTRQNASRSGPPHFWGKKNNDSWSNLRERESVVSGSGRRHWFFFLVGGIGDGKRRRHVPWISHYVSLLSVLQPDQNLCIYVQCLYVLGVIRTV